MAKNSAKPKSLLIDGWEVVIGIEIHTQLATQSKIFSGSSTEFGQDPNTQASLVDLAMPGVLPVLNKEVVDLAIRFGLGIDAYIDQASVFARKNYFYPDSPKGYQISQMDNPIVAISIRPSMINGVSNRPRKRVFSADNSDNFCKRTCACNNSACIAVFSRRN